MNGIDYLIMADGNLVSARAAAANANNAQALEWLADTQKAMDEYLLWKIRSRKAARIDRLNELAEGEGYTAVQACRLLQDMENDLAARSASDDEMEKFARDHGL